MNTREYILSLSEKIGLDPHAALYAIPVAEKMENTPLPDELWQLIRDKKPASGWFKLHAKELSCEENRLALAATLLLTRNMKAVYDKNGWDGQIYYDSLRDIAIWAECCKKETGLWGMAEFGWLSRTLCGRLWRLGRMQFELYAFDAGSYEKNGLSLKNGDAVINTHIPEGEPLTPEKRKDSFDRAVKFFGSNVFLCESWLLWPAHYEMLKSDSNIISFMNDFDIFRSFEHPGAGNLWRIFGYLSDYRPDRLPAETSMQRAYIKRLRENGGLTGGGYGIHIHP